MKLDSASILIGAALAAGLVLWLVGKKLQRAGLEDVLTGRATIQPLPTTGDFARMDR